jgi:hypothetical protein
MQAVLDTISRASSAAMIPADTDGPPHVAGFDVDASLRSRRVFAVEDADFEVDEVKRFDDG